MFGFLCGTFKSGSASSSLQGTCELEEERGIRSGGAGEKDRRDREGGLASGCYVQVKINSVSCFSGIVEDGDRPGVDMSRMLACRGGSYHPHSR